MKTKTVFEITMTLFLIGVLTSAVDIQLVKASGTIYIRADGSIDPLTAPISTIDNVTYIFTGNIYDPIVVQRDNIVIDRAGYTVKGKGTIGSGIALWGRSNITIKNTEIKEFEYAIDLSGSSNNSISGNKITNNLLEGIYLSSSSNNSVSGNDVTGNRDGIYVVNSQNNSISGNNVTNREWGIYLDYSSNNCISRNRITNNKWGIYLFHSSNNSICRNNVTANTEWGIYLEDSSDNVIYHNNFVNNAIQVHSYNSINAWDDGYPSGGNYWSDYPGVDEKSGPDQDQPGSDGIGDTPYIIDVYYNRDRYPLMNPWLMHDVAVTNCIPSKTVVGQGYSLNINATLANQGDHTETFDVTLHGDGEQSADEIGLVGCWKFDEGTGTAAYDSSGNGNNGTLVNGPTWVNGKLGKALNLDGVDDHVLVPDSTVLKPLQYTVAVWVKIDAVQVGGDPVWGNWIVGKEYLFKGYGLSFIGTEPIAVHSDGAAHAIDSNINVSLNDWHHIASTYNGTLVKIYVDGMLRNSEAHGFQNTNDPLTIGAWHFTSPERFLNGTIDEVKVYDRALSADEVWSEYTHACPNTNTNYHFG